MRRFELVVVAVVGLAGACGGGGKDAAVCRREAAELSQLLTTMDHELPGFFADGVPLVTRADLPATTTYGYGPSVTVTKEGATFEGEPIASADAADRLAAVRRQASDRAAAGRRGADDPLVYLIVADDARWEDVARALTLLDDAGFRRPALAFARPPTPVTPPPRSKIDDELDRIVGAEDASNKATELARLMEQVVKSCPALIRLFGSVAVVDGESKAETIIRGIEPALVECNCSLDVPSLRSAMFRLLHVETPQGSFRITLADDGEPITLPLDTRWREAHARFSPDARVAIAPPP